MSGERIAPSSARDPSLTTASYQELRGLIAEKFGIDYPPHRRSALASRLECRLEAHGLRSFAAYGRHLRSLQPNDVEWDLLAELLTNSETYFFREPKQLEQAAALVPALAGNGREPLRVLSAGCSSGEEAYSLAMVLAVHAPRPWHFEVHGVDVTPARLEKARAGCYPLRSVTRGTPPPAGVTAEQFGTIENEHWQAHERLRMRLHFHQRNLVDPRGLGLGLFDLVFCRNVLIYAHPDRIPAFADQLCAALRPGGHLFLGSSETLLGADPSLRPMHRGDHFMYRKGDDDPGSHRG